MLGSLVVNRETASLFMRQQRAALLFWFYSTFYARFLPIAWFTHCATHAGFCATLTHGLRRAGSRFFAASPAPQDGRATLVLPPPHACAHTCTHTTPTRAARACAHLPASPFSFITICRARARASAARAPPLILHTPMPRGRFYAHNARFATLLRVYIFARKNAFAFCALRHFRAEGGFAPAINENKRAAHYAAPYRLPARCLPMPATAAA